MGSNFVFDNSLYNYHSSPESDFFSSFCAIDDVLQNPIDFSSDHIFSSSPPSQLLGNLSLYQSTKFQNLSNFNGFEVKSEEIQVGFDECQPFLPYGEAGDQNETNFMQRSNSFEAESSFFFQRGFDTTSMESHMRRVCSTGDLQNNNIRRGHASDQRSVSTESEEPAGARNLKVQRYSAEERKERISKYRAKRTLRNFNKTIKYACRKTLADNRPRIRGRFARNEESCDNTKAVACCSTKYEDEDDDNLWVLEHREHEEQENRTLLFQTSFPHHQYYGF